MKKQGCISIVALLTFLCVISAQNLLTPHRRKLISIVKVKRSFHTPSQAASSKTKAITVVSSTSTSNGSSDSTLPKRKIEATATPETEEATSYETKETSKPSNSSAPSSTQSFTPSLTPSTSLDPSTSSAPSLPLCTTSVPWAGVLVFYGLTPDCLLPECAGHCNTDSDCAADLFCYRPGSLRSTDSVPGCETVPYTEVNYCVANGIKPSSTPSLSPSTKPSSIPLKSFDPSGLPTKKTSSKPSVSFEPSFLPSSKPSGFPSHSPTIKPSVSPTLTMTPTECRPEWKQLGNSIDTSDDWFAMAKDRLVVAAGTDKRVHVYSFDDNSMSWIQIAEPIDPKMGSYYGEGYSLVLSSEGDVLAIGDRQYLVKIFALHPDNGWAQIGQTITGERVEDYTGWSLGISSDGTTVAIGAAFNSNDNGTWSGHVRVYQYSTQNLQWIQKGDDIDGESAYDYFGYALSMSRDAAVLAIGAWRNDGNGTNSGHVRVYVYDKDKQKWTQQGPDLDGEAKRDHSGGSVALSGDGSTIAIGAPQNDGNGSDAGHVRIFRCDRTNSNWVQMGGDIDGEAQGTYSGRSVDISDDGMTVVIGAKYNGGADAGHTRVFQYDTLDRDWFQQGADLDDNAGNYFGYDTSISADGTVVGTTGKIATHLTISKWTSCAMPPPSSMPSITPNCADGNHTLRFDITTDRFPHQTTWDIRNFEEEIVLSSAPYKKRFTFHSESYCLKHGCYRFTIQDSSSDGICCDWFTGNGNYKIFFDTDLIKEGGSFASDEGSIQFGLACPSSAPSISSSPSSRPSSTPSESKFLCPIGTFLNNTKTEVESQCQPCPSGTYQDIRTNSEMCRKCEAGTYQPDEGKSTCLSCEAGAYQVAVGQTKCDTCRKGGYCGTDLIGTCDGGFKPCRAGTYNNRTGQYNETACVPCPPGKYGDKEGLTECLPCPFRLGTISNSSTVCSICDAGFYLKDPNTNITELLKKPDDSCLHCPDHTECPMNTTLETLLVLPNFWRDSLQTATVYRCNHDGACIGGNTVLTNSSSRSSVDSYCKDGHSGPLCETCEKGRYLKEGSGECSDCPTSKNLIATMGAIISICIVIIMGYVVTSSSTKGKQCLLFISNKISCLSIQAKFKIIISFYQVFNVMENIYGVRMDEKFKAWFNFLRLVDFRLLNYVMPKQCFGSLKFQIILSSVWPFILLAILILGIIMHAMCHRKVIDHGGKLIEKAFFRSMHFMIIMVYVLLPSVSNSIFHAIRCKSFVTNDDRSIESSYLLEDLSITCNKSDNNYERLLATFWVLFTVWPVAMPVLFAGLLWYIRKSVRLDCITDLSEACRFLWRDYHKSMMFWEVLDVVRKIFLTGLILFVDKEQGAERILRLVIAIIISIVYLCLLALARPYKRAHDLYLSFISNTLLSCCFLVGIVIHACNKGDESCQGFIGLADSYDATIFAVAMTGGMLILTTVFTIVVGRTTTPTPIILVTSTSSPPNLEISNTCHFHVFLSHIWSTGQDKTHNVARMLQLYLPGIRIWLDVDELKDVGTLEKSVADSELFILFYSIGYFKSENCRREISTAVQLGKQILILYVGDGDGSSMDTMKLECAAFFTDTNESERILKHALRKDQIQWLGGSAQMFSQMSVKLVALRLLQNLPYYCKHQTELNQGLQLGNRLNSAKFIYPQRIFVCRDNVGISDVINEFEEEISNKVSYIADNTHFDSRSGLDLTDEVILLYLNKELFQDKDGIVHKFVKGALNIGMEVVLVQEMDATKGYCDFKQLISQTPNDLLISGIFVGIAIPWYPLEQYRHISLHLVQEKMNDVCVSNRINTLHNGLS